MMDIDKFTQNANDFVNQYSESELLDHAIMGWMRADAEAVQARPIKDEIKKIILEIVRESVDDITGKYSDIVALTLTVATKAVIFHIESKLGWQLPPAYDIPLSLIIALVYKKSLKVINDNVQKS